MSDAALRPARRHSPRPPAQPPTSPPPQVPAQPGEAPVQLPRARRARLQELDDDQAAEEEADPDGRRARPEGEVRARGEAVPPGEPDLTEEYKTITEQFKDLHNKFQHFEVADTKRYRDVWQMHKEEVTELMRKVLQADKIIHEQLGLGWFPPSEHIFEAGADDGGQRRAAAGADDDGGAGPLRGQMDNESIKRMLELLCNEASFLVEEDSEAAQAALPTTSLLRIDSILRCWASRAPPTSRSYCLLLGRRRQPQAHPPERRDQGDQGVCGETPGRARTGRRGAQAAGEGGAEGRGARSASSGADVVDHLRQDVPRGGAGARARQVQHPRHVARRAHLGGGRDAAPERRARALLNQYLVEDRGPPRPAHPDDPPRPFASPAAAEQRER